MEYKDRGDLFEGLFIWKDGKYRDLQGTYPVIFLSFANVKENTFCSVREMICQLLKNLYAMHSYLLESGLLKESEKAYYNRVLRGMDGSDVSLALYQLCGYLYRYYGKKTIILLDEYDAPMMEAYKRGFLDEMIAFLRNLFHSTFKVNPYLERALMTGVTRVSREDIFWDLDNLRVVTTTSKEYATAFGFTEEEVFTSMDECGLSDRKEKVKYLYDGFIFGKQRNIYNPRSIITYLRSQRFETQCANTRASEWVGNLLRKSSIDIKEKFEQLLKGEAIAVTLDEHFVYEQLEQNMDAFWGYLLEVGYVKVLDKEDEGKIAAWEMPKYQITLTNKEVQAMFGRLVYNWFAQTDGEYNAFLQALLQGDIEAMNAYMNRVALYTFSCFDTGKEPAFAEPERFYHGFVLGLMVDLQSRYSITSNRESGFERYDVVLEPKKKESGDYAYILEFKVHDPEDEKDLKATVAAALAQIEEKNYAESLIEKGIPAKKIKKYGFAFEGKNVLIG